MLASKCPNAPHWGVIHIHRNEFQTLSGPLRVGAVKHRQPCLTSVRLQNPEIEKHRFAAK